MTDNLKEKGVPIKEINLYELDARLTALEDKIIAIMNEEYPQTPHNPTDTTKRTIPVIDIADVPKLIERREMAQKAGGK